MKLVHLPMEDLRQAIAEADRGIFVSSEAVDRWMESWGTENELPMPEPDIFPEGLRTPEARDP